MNENKTTGFGGIMKDILIINEEETIFALAVGYSGVVIQRIMLPNIYETISVIIDFGVVYGVVTSCDKHHIFIFARDYGITVYNIE